MIRNLPGTTIEAELSRPDAAPRLLHPLFLAGGLTLSQISSLTGLEPYVIQNWVKRGFVAPPVCKRYTQRQFCRIAIINMLKDCLQLDKITQLLSYLNGHLDDESDDMLDDAQLYFYIALLTARVELNPAAGSDQWFQWCDLLLADFQEPFPGVRDRVIQVLRITITAYAAARLKGAAELMLRGLKGAEPA